MIFCVVFFVICQKTKKMKYIDIALQGGGSHGAFTWGVLESLLEHKDLHIAGICGTSAGAMNAALLAYGLMTGGKDKAKELLHQFWRKVAEVNAFTPIQPNWFDKMMSPGNMDYSFTFNLLHNVMQFISPYQFNPLNINPLRKILLDLINFETLKNCDQTKLFICATNVRRGRAKVFKTDEISVDAVLASACLPYLFQAVTIDGEDYWDGGYMGNPPIFPLIDGTDCSDILIVQINPIEIDKTPKTALEIQDRINELSFNSSLMLEMRRVNFVQKLLENNLNIGNKFKELRLHNINPEKDLAQFNTSSKLNANWDFLLWLHKLGKQYGKTWLEQNFDKIGVESSCDVQKVFL